MRYNNSKEKASADKRGKKTVIKVDDRSYEVMNNGALKPCKSCK